MAKNPETSSITKETKRTSKYDWVDTAASTTHQFNSDPFTGSNVRRTWIILTVVTLVAIAFGWYVIGSSPTPARKGERFVTDQRSKMEKPFQNATVVTLPEGGWTAAASDGQGNLYLSNAGGIERFDVSGTKTGSWPIAELTVSTGDVNQASPLQNPVTALCVVPEGRGPASLANRILLACGDKVYTLRIDQDDRTLYPVPFKLADNARIQSMCVSTRYLFLADAAHGLISRFDLAEEEPPLSFGEADETTGFPGFRLVDDMAFQIAWSPENEILYATNPGLFQVVAFNAASGQWIKERSWDKRPWAAGGFAGVANPYGLALFRDGQMVLSEKATPPVVRLFSRSGQELQNLTGTVTKTETETGGLLCPVVVNDNTLILWGTDANVLVLVRRIPLSDKTE